MVPNLQIKRFSIENHIISFSINSTLKVAVLVTIEVQHSDNYCSNRILLVQ